MQQLHIVLAPELKQSKLAMHMNTAYVIKTEGDTDSAAACGSRFVPQVCEKIAANRKCKNNCHSHPSLLI